MRAVCPMPCGRSENLLGPTYLGSTKNQSLVNPKACVDTPLAYHDNLTYIPKRTLHVLKS